MSLGFNFVLPLEDEPEEDQEDEQLTMETQALLIVESGDKKNGRNGIQPPKKKKNVLEKRSRIGIFRHTFAMLIFHVFIFLALFSALFASFHYCLNDERKKDIMKAVTTLDDWRQLVFFFGIFLSFAVRKVCDVSNVS